MCVQTMTFEDCFLKHWAEHDMFCQKVARLITYRLSQESSCHLKRVRKENQNTMTNYPPLDSQVLNTIYPSNEIDLNLNQF